MNFSGLRIIAISCAYNEERKIGEVIERIKKNQIDEILIVNDASTDNTKRICEEKSVTVISHPRRMGAGASLRTALEYALEKEYRVAVLIAGNNKDAPEEIVRLVEPIAKEGFDLVQGSRYLPMGKHGNMPFYRQIATKYIHPWLFSYVSGLKMTDTTNGFRAIRLSILKNKEINLRQEWLVHYELEPYLLYKAIKTGYRVKEVPVSKIYPPREQGYTKMKPISGWWSILKPLVYLYLGLKK